MVDALSKIPRSDDGGVLTDAWIDQICDTYTHLQPDALSAIAEVLAPSGLTAGVEFAQLAAELNLDAPSIYAALGYRAVREARLSVGELTSILGAQSFDLARAITAMSSVSLLEMSSSALQATEQESQVENIRRMIVGLIDDPRVAVLKIAERVVAMRHAKRYDQRRRLRAAQEAMYVFAPLAGRLGIAQLKWELEDLALRYTEEDTYKRIAQQLASKRSEREMQMRMIEDRVRTLLRSNGLDVTVYGRAKHIFSIWNKMQIKQLPFEQVYDVRAIRIITENLAECYACLGVIHARWSHVPSELDDYIANPKENGYRSIHTAVTMENGESVEIQIRTLAMHEDAELGLCAHWSYKGDNNLDAERSHDFQRKVEWLRQVLEWHDDFGGKENLSTMLLREGGSEARIYVSTPKGHLLDLPSDATVLDFAYRVHTDVGHACRGAVINDTPAVLGQTLQNSQTVSINTSGNPQPARDWLEPGYDFVRTDRARAKLVRYFRGLQTSEKKAIGEQIYRDALALLATAVEVNLDEEQAVDLGGGIADLLPLLSPILEQSVQNGVLPDQRQTGSHIVGLFLKGQNRDGLLHDVTQVLAHLEYPLTANTGDTLAEGSVAMINIETEVECWRDILKLAAHLATIEGVTQVGRWQRERNLE